MASTVKEKKPMFLKRIPQYFRDLRSEAKKIVWPNRKQTIQNTIIVIVMMGIVGAFIWILDFIFTYLLALIIK